MNPLLFLLVSLIFFLRGDIPFFTTGISPSKLIPAVVAIVLLVQVVRYRVRFGSHAAFMFFVFIVFFISVLVNVYIVPEESAHILVFFAEVFLNMLVYLVAYNMFLEVDIKRLSAIHFSSGVMFSLPAIIISMSLEKVRRIGAGGDEEAALPVAVNHIGHSLTIAIVFGVIYYIVHIYKLNFFKKMIFAFGLLMTVASMLLTGSKAGLLGLLALIVFFYFRLVGKKTLILALPIIALASITLLSSLEFSKYDNLVSRFSIERFFVAFDQRSESLQSAFRSVPDGVQILGYPWRYQLINRDQPIPYPHNFFASILLHLGILSFVLFCIYAFITFVKLGMDAFVRKSLLARILLVMLVTVFIYVLTSGRLTRVMTIFWVFGMVDSYLDHMRKRDGDCCSDKKHKAHYL